MATAAQNLLARRNQVCENIAGIYDGDMDDPNSGGTPGVDKVGKIKAWYEELDAIDRRLAALEGAYEITSEMRG